MDDFMRYQMERVATEFSIGWFACLPSYNLDFEEALEYIQKHPYDDFMHKYLLDLTGTFGPNLVDMLIKKGKEDDPYLLTLMYETYILNEKLQALKTMFDGVDVKQLAEYTPHIYINWVLIQNQADNLYWVRLFSENIYAHKPLPSPEYLKHPVPLDRNVIEDWRARVVSIEGVLKRMQRAQRKNITNLFDSSAPIALSVISTPSRLSFRAKRGILVSSLRAGSGRNLLAWNCVLFDQDFSLAPFGLSYIRPELMSKAGLKTDRVFRPWTLSNFCRARAGTFVRNDNVG